MQEQPAAVVACLVIELDRQHLQLFIEHDPLCHEDDDVALVHTMSPNPKVYPFDHPACLADYRRRPPPRRAKRRKILPEWQPEI